MTASPYHHQQYHKQYHQYHQFHTDNKSMQSQLLHPAIIVLMYMQILRCTNSTSNILSNNIAKAVSNAVSLIYGAAARGIIVTVAAQTAAAYSSMAVVAQGRAPSKGDMGARPIYGILCIKPTFSQINT